MNEIFLSLNPSVAYIFLDVCVMCGLGAGSCLVCVAGVHHDGASLSRRRGGAFHPRRAGRVCVLRRVRSGWPPLPQGAAEKETGVVLLYYIYISDRDQNSYITHITLDIVGVRDEARECVSAVNTGEWTKS